ncbi:hypothetical protein K0M31_018382 [Melipona bicolor]|uniref:Uncharacterized protein n=1 Tax=Melipona bicolor TaxID=60889 RepID=A0AA40G3C9_9HYME|nr:hypothetical protein K0M31_018382 [Melipona bicolor]
MDKVPATKDTNLLVRCSIPSLLRQARRGATTLINVYTNERTQRNEPATTTTTTMTTTTTTMKKKKKKKKEEKNREERENWPLRNGGDSPVSHMPPLSWRPDQLVFRFSAFRETLARPVILSFSHLTLFLAPLP